MQRVSLPWAGVMILTTVVTVVLRGWRWVVLMRPFAPQVKTSDASMALMICYAANFFIPRSGEALRALSLKWKRGIAISPVLATVVVERILDLVWLIIFMGIALLIARDRINDSFPEVEPYSLAALAGCAVALTCLLLISVFKDQAIHFADKLLSPLSTKLSATVTRHLATFIQGLGALRNPSAYFEIVVSSSLLNLGYIMIIYAGFICFGLTNSAGLGISAALVVMAISSIGVIIPAAGAIGTYHYFFKESLHLLYLIPEIEALACATVVHAFSNSTYFIFGLPALIMQRRQARKKSTR